MLSHLLDVYRKKPIILILVWMTLTSCFWSVQSHGADEILEPNESESYLSFLDRYRDESDKDMLALALESYNKSRNQLFADVSVNFGLAWNYCGLVAFAKTGDFMARTYFAFEMIHQDYKDNIPVQNLWKNLLERLQPEEMDADRQILWAGTHVHEKCGRTLSRVIADAHEIELRGWYLQRKFFRDFYKSTQEAPQVIADKVNQESSALTQFVQSAWDKYVAPIKKRFAQDDGDTQEGQKENQTLNSNEEDQQKEEGEVQPAVPQASVQSFDDAPVAEISEELVDQNAKPVELPEGATPPVPAAVNPSIKKLLDGTFELDEDFAGQASDEE